MLSHYTIIFIQKKIVSVPTSVVGSVTDIPGIYRSNDTVSGSRYSAHHRWLVALATCTNGESDEARPRPHPVTQPLNAHNPASDIYSIM